MAKKSPEVVEEKLPSMERDILKDIRERVSANGATGFKFRVMKKRPGGGFTWRGFLDGTVEDVYEELFKQWKDGVYHLYAHFLDNKRVPNTPPMEFIVGDPDQPEAKAPGADGAVPPSKRLAQLDEEIEAKRKERDLRRAEKDLRKLETEDEDEGGRQQEVYLEAIKGLEDEIESLRVGSREDKLMAEIADLKRRFDDEDGGGRKRRDPEIEALKARLAAAEESARKSELATMQAGFNAQMNELKMALNLSQQGASRWTAKDVTALAVPLVPVLTTWIEKNAGTKGEALEIVERVTTALKGQPKGMDLKEILTVAAPYVMPLLNKKDDSISSVLGLVGNLVAPMVQAAADAAANPPNTDDLGSSIKNLFGMIQKSLADAKEMQSKTLETEKVRAQAIERVSRHLPGSAPRRAIAPPVAAQAVAQQPPPPARAPRPMGQAPQPAPRHPVEPVANRTATPIVRFVGRLSAAIAEQDEEVEHYAGLAAKELPPESLESFRAYSSGEMFASFLLSFPGADRGLFTSPYGKHWLDAFLAALRGDLPATVVSPAEVVVPTNIVSLHSGPEPSGAVKVREFTYPKDSVVERVRIDDLDLPLEYPTQATLAKRDAERASIQAEVVRKSAVLLEVKS